VRRALRKHRVSTLEKHANGVHILVLFTPTFVAVASEKGMLIITLLLLALWQAAASCCTANGLLPQGKLSSIVPAFTSFTYDGAINKTTVADQYAYAVQNKIDVLLLMGTTGEWPTLTVDERMQLAGAWCDAKKRQGGQIKFLLNVGHASPYEARRLAAHATTLDGVDALLISPPGLPYHATSLDTLIDSLAIALEPAPTIPCFYYHYLDLYGDAFKMVELFEAAKKGRLPTLVGAKFAGSGISLVDVAQASAFDPARFGTLVTADKVETVSSLTPGPRGLIVLDYEGALAQEIFRAVERNDTNLFTQATLRLFHWRSFPSKYNAAGGNYQVTGTKGVARIAGLALGGSRPPLPSITEVDLAALKDDLTQAGMLPQPLQPY
jgi:N-acetylneuraminate lyase